MIAVVLFVVTVAAVAGCCVGLRRERRDWGRLEMTETRRAYLAAEAARNDCQWTRRTVIPDGRTWK